jgi:preprotein translocase subunit SecG
VLATAEPVQGGVGFASAFALTIFHILMTLLINFLLALYVLVALLMLLVILMQRPRSEGLGAAFGGGVTENIFGAQTTNVLVKITAWLAGIFFALTFVLSILYAHKTSGDSALRRELLKQETAPAPSAAPSATKSSSPAASAASDSGVGVLPAGSATPVASPRAMASVAPTASPAASTKPKRE